MEITGVQCFNGLWPLWIMAYDNEILCLILFQTESFQTGDLCSGNRFNLWS